MDDFPTRLRDMLAGHALTTLIAIGHRTGLFEAAAQGPGSSAELAARAGLDERYVREWLGAMVTGGIMDRVDHRYVLPEAHAALLTGQGASNAGPSANMLRLLTALSARVEDRFADGGGVPYSAYAAAAGRMGEQWRPIYDEHLISGFLGAVPGLDARLRRGASVLDVGCGTGHAVNLMAREYPDSRFTGLDLAPEAVAAAETERVELGLANAVFVQDDAARLPPSPSFDVITAFDAVHDQQAPAQVLRCIRAALRPEGVFVMIDTDFASSVDDNIGNPHAPLAYAISLLFCVPTSLAAGGPALGAMWGRDTACAMLADAGFAEVTVLVSPRPQNCIYVCTT